jgi:hypothetical protein
MPSYASNSNNSKGEQIPHHSDFSPMLFSNQANGTKNQKNENYRNHQNRHYLRHPKLFIEFYIVQTTTAVRFWKYQKTTCSAYLQTQLKNTNIFLREDSNRTELQLKQPNTEKMKSHTQKQVKLLFSQ